MPDPSWASSPPEANYLRLAGVGAAGAASTLASAAAWQSVAAGNEVAASVSTLNTSVTAADFQGVGGVSSAARATGLNSALHLLSGWAQQKVPIAGSAVEAYQSAVAAMIPAEVSLANRAEQAANVALNPLVFGALTPAIIALDAVYFGEYWPHNATAGIAYGTTLAGLAAALAVPPPLAPPGAAANAPATAAAVAQAAGQAAAGEAMSQSAQLAATPAEMSGAPVQAAAQAAGTAAQAVQPLGSALGGSQPLNGMFATTMQAVPALAGWASPSSADIGGPVDGWSAGIPLTAAALPGAGAGGPVSTFEPAGSTARGAVAGAGGISAAPGAGLTSYARPATGFAQESPGRPTTVKAGLLDAAELRGPTTLGPTVAPAGPASTGMLNRGKPEDGKTPTPPARVETEIERPLVRRNS